MSKELAQRPAHDDVHDVGQEIMRAPAPAQTIAVMPQVQASELVGRLNVIREAMNTAMQNDVDYGVVPGTDKPTLFKPGAEKLSVLFQLDVQLDNEKHWGPGDHLTVESKATVYHAPTGQRLGFGEGMCSTRERKYAYRRQERSCPECGAEAVIKGKEEFGGGWLCWRKRGGCGAKFANGSEAIEGQTVGDVDNPDLPDLWNTVIKMAEKRARVDAVLAVTGASALFTQDVEDVVMSEAAVVEHEPPPKPPKRAPARPRDVPPDTLPPDTLPPLTPPPLLDQTKAAELLINADSAGLDRDVLRRAAEHTFGNDLPSFEDDALALEALQKLDVHQGERISRWIERKRTEFASQ